MCLSPWGKWILNRPKEQLLTWKNSFEIHYTTFLKGQHFLNLTIFFKFLYMSKIIQSLLVADQMCQVNKWLATKNKQRNKNLNFCRKRVHWKLPKRCHYIKLETISIWKHIIQPRLIQSQDRRLVKLVASSEAFQSISFLDSFPHDPTFTSWFLL